MRVTVQLTDQTFEHTRSIGILNVSLGLTRALAVNPRVEQLTVLTNHSLGAVAGPESARVQYRGLDHTAPRGLARVLEDQLRVTRNTDDARADWLLLPKGFPPRLSWPAARVCCYIHDDIAVRQPEGTFSVRAGGERAYFGAMLRRALQRADLIVTNSRFTAGQLRSLQGAAARIVPIGVGMPPRAASRGARRHVLLLTSAHPHKLTSQALAWLARWDDANGRRYPIVAVGALPSGASWPERSNWRHLPRLADPQFQSLFDDALVLLYFSAYEGYGMPPREALVRRVWTCACDLPALREDVPAELLFDHHAYPSFATRMDEVVGKAVAGVEPPSLTLPTWDEVAGRLLDAMDATDPR